MVDSSQHVTAGPVNRPLECCMPVTRTYGSERAEGPLTAPGLFAKLIGSARRWE